MDNYFLSPVFWHRFTWKRFCSKFDMISRAWVYCINDFITLKICHFVRFEVKLQRGLECGGAYIKLLMQSDDLDLVSARNVAKLFWSSLIEMLSTFYFCRIIILKEVIRLFVAEKLSRQDPLRRHVRSRQVWQRHEGIRVVLVKRWVVAIERRIKNNFYQ